MGSGLGDNEVSYRYKLSSDDMTSAWKVQPQREQPEKSNLFEEGGGRQSRDVSA